MTTQSSESVSVLIQVWINYDLYPTDESATPWDAVDDPRKEYHNPEAFYSFKSVRKIPPPPLLLPGTRRMIQEKSTVNQLNFAARKFRRLLIIANLGIFCAIKFRVLVVQDLLLTKTSLHKNACNFINNGPIFKI